jgi:hypothetical protein
MFSNKPTSQRHWPSQTILNLRCPEVWFNLWNTPAYGHLRLPWRPAAPFRDLVPYVSSEAVCAFKVVVPFSGFHGSLPHVVILLFVNYIRVPGSRCQHIYVHRTPNYNMSCSITFNPPQYINFSVIYIYFQEE